MEDEGKEERSQRVALLSSGGAGDPGLAEEEMRGIVVARFCPSRGFRAALSDSPDKQDFSSSPK